MAVLASVVAFHETPGTLTIENGNSMFYKEVLEEAGADYDRVLVSLHGMRDGYEGAASRLLEHGYYGESIDNVKVIFPNGYDFNLVEDEDIDEASNDFWSTLFSMTLLLEV